MSIVLAASPRVAVVVPSHDRSESLGALLTGLEMQQPPPIDIEVVVIDDGSSYPHAEAIRRRLGQSSLCCRLIRCANGRGPAVARNLGWRSTAADLVAFIDDDCVPEAGWLDAGVRAMVDDPRVGVVQGRTLAPCGVSVHRLEDWYLWRIVEQPGPHFEGCNIFYRRTALEAAGGFDEDIGWWGEDTALGWRVIELSWARGFASDAIVRHPVERRGWRWFVEQGLREANLVTLAERHPGFRREAFWRPWAYRGRDPAFLLAVAGIMASRSRRPWPAILALPYLLQARPSVRRLSFFRLMLQIPVVDAARLIGHLRGSVRHRVLVL